MHGLPPHFQKNGVVNNCAAKDEKYEEENQIVAYEEGHHDLRKLVFTVVNYRALLALLQS